MLFLCLHVKALFSTKGRCPWLSPVDVHALAICMGLSAFTGWGINVGGKIGLQDLNVHGYTHAQHGSVL
jgi:hypothetical protein